ncbi:GGDEF domain-containing protein [Ihubacter massiliensis]|uniref:GGDEF domain-containing protein n=1 Tax=Hominibacterium faecale TaxID=2839743 RepID=A0A9J6QLJ3_9FIRM|nr:MULTISPECIES: GGDEF domain-containing protein [Eubacteriales Family XIII. Incertae Sedis]MCO7121117.1 GGDEF domain-containing protein [Ihubacter massiliensis]MCU7378033.1 GGDEF domain-containing protein [Hominibacterium faecale]
MKKAITLRLCIVIVVSMAATAVLSYYIQIKSAREAMETNAELRINQVKEILEKNSAEIEKLKQNLEEDYFVRAKAAAYIIQNQPEVIDDLKELRKIASLLQVDELHLFDTKGKLFSGSVPKYYNYTFESGEQMKFFLPMLKDKSMQLCQEVTPNTAENKLMQYIAVWREDQKGIVQIGMEPIRLLEAMKKNELSHIFDLMTTEDGITIFAVDLDTGKISGSTDKQLLNKKAADLGLDVSAPELGKERQSGKITFGGKDNYCVMEATDNVLVCVSGTHEKIYENVPSNMALIIFSLALLAIVVILLLLRILDNMIINGIYGIIAGTKKIAAGDLDYRVEIDHSPEFAMLSSNLNHMVESLLETTSKLSLVFQSVDIPVAVYEYNQDMERVLATSKIGEILLMPEEELRQILSSRKRFAEKIAEICTHPYELEKDVYLIDQDEGRKHYVKIKFYQEERKTLGIVVDMTAEIIEKRKIERERDVDLLTGLYTRRAFFSKFDALLQEPEELKTAMVLMADLDNLKYTNDHWGHDYGDKMLKAAADLLQGCDCPHNLAARLSGDEFVLVIYGAKSQQEIEDCLDCLYSHMKKSDLVMPDGEHVAVSLSGGYLYYPEHTGTSQELLKLADKAMYKVKKSTKGKFGRYRAEDDKI